MNENQQLNLPTGFEKMLFEGLIRAFFTGQSYYNSSGYMQTDPAPMAGVTSQIIAKVQPALIEAIISQIDIEQLVEKARSSLDMKAIEKEVTRQVKEKVLGKLK